MKTLSLFLLGLVMAVYIPISAQTTESIKQEVKVDVPDHVTTKFSNDYPQTTDTKWKMEDDAFVVEFTTASNGNHKVWYDKSGVKQKEERELNHEADLPLPVQEALREHFGSYVVKNVSQGSGRGITSYRITVDENGTRKQLVINGDGQIVEREFRPNE